MTYDEPGSVSPYVQGQIDHARSGLSLTAGKTVVELEDFVVDPGGSVLTGKVSVNGKKPLRAPRCPSSSGARSTRWRPRTTAPPSCRARRSSSRPRPPTCSTRRSKIDALEEGFVIGVATITVNTA